MKKIPRKKQRPGKKPTAPGKGPLPKYNRTPFSWMIVGLIVMSILMMISGMQRVEKIDSFSPKFEDYIEKGYIKSIRLLPNRIKGDFSQVWLTEHGSKADRKSVV